MEVWAVKRAANHPTAPPDAGQPTRLVVIGVFERDPEQLDVLDGMEARRDERHPQPTVTWQCPEQDADSYPEADVAQKMNGFEVEPGASSL